MPTAESLDVDGLDITPGQVEKVLAVDPAEWRDEVPQIQAWFEKMKAHYAERDYLGRTTAELFPPSFRTVHP